jgi:hypothetical protein
LQKMYFLVLLLKNKIHLNYSKIPCFVEMK